MAKINVLVVPPDGHGVGKFRIISPYTHLQDNYPDDFHVDIKTDFDMSGDNDPFEKYDIIVIHSFLLKNNGFDDKGNPKPVPLAAEIRLINKLKNQGKIVIVDTDDFWMPNPKHPMYRSIIAQNIHVKKREFLQNASYITTTTPVYRDTIRKKLNLNNIQVFPNAIDVKEKQFHPQPLPSDRVRFGWLGGSSHLHDMMLMRNGLSLMGDSFKNETQLVLCGFDLRGTINEMDPKTKEIKQRPIQPKETVWYEYEKMFTKNYQTLSEDYAKFLQSFKNEEFDATGEHYIRRWTEDISKYAKNYNYFDVSLAPLVNHEFNNNKSQLKVIEAGFHKKPIIASECNPYTIDLVNVFEKGGGINPKGNALLIPEHKTHKLWGKYMSYLVKNPNMIIDLGEKLHEMVMSKYTLDIVNKNRAEFFKSIINK